MPGLKSRDITAAGKAGTLRSIADTVRRRKERKAGEVAEAEISNIRVPISMARPQAMSSPIGEAIDERKAQGEAEVAAQTEGQVVAPEEQAVAQEQFDETNKAIQDKKDLEVRAVDEIPIMKSLEPYPSAKSRLMQLAEANGWVKMIGGVATISNKQMQLAQGIIGKDLNLRKSLNELALNDITQNIQALQQAKLDPKLKEEDAANIDAQLEQLAKEQNNKLNAVNMMDRKIQQDLALQKPAAAAEVNTTNLMYQDKEGNYRWGLHDESGKLIKDLRAATSKEIKDKDSKGLDVGKYRSYLRDATSNAYKELFANDETMMQEIAQLDADISEEEKAKIEAKIHRDLSPTQRAKLTELRETWFKEEAPESIWKQYKKIKGAKRTGTKAITDPLGLR
jgi:hypothetical protein